MPRKRDHFFLLFCIRGIFSLDFCKRGLTFSFAKLRESKLSAIFDLHMIYVMAFRIPVSDITTFPRAERALSLICENQDF